MKPRCPQCKAKLDGKKIHETCRKCGLRVRIKQSAKRVPR